MVGEEADGVAMRAAAEAMVEAFSSLTVKLGVFSLWKGQQALNSRPP